MASKVEYSKQYHQNKQKTDPEYRKKKNDRAKEHYHTKNKNTIVLLNTKRSEPMEDWELELEWITMKARQRWHNEIVPQMRREYYERLKTAK